jgi:predicted small lipoprotein YifL
MYRHYLKLLPLLLCLSGCGQTGPLYLPEKAAPPPAVESPPPADEPAPEPRE